MLTDVQLDNAIALSQSSPGPLGLYVAVTGYFVAGLGGAAAGVLALMTPAFLAIPIARLLLRHPSRALQAACAGVGIASCGLIILTGLRLAPAAAPTFGFAVLITLGALVVATTTIKPVWVIGIAALAGLVAG